jgi:hypothetical protein
MSRIVIVILIYHRHKPVDLKYCLFCGAVCSEIEILTSVNNICHLLDVDLQLSGEVLLVYPPITTVLYLAHTYIAVLRKKIHCGLAPY